MADKKKITLLLICLFFIGIFTSACGDSGSDILGDLGYSYYPNDYYDYNYDYDNYNNNTYPTPNPTLTPIPTPTTDISQEVIHLSQKVFSMNVGEVAYITVKVGDKDVTNSARFVQNSDDIATVENGKITARQPGTTLVSVYVDGAITSDHFVITVIDPTLPTLEVSQAEFNMGIGDTENVVVKLNGQDVTKLVTYTSDDKNIATVENGVITAEYNEGTAEIIVSLEGANEVEFVVNVVDDSDGECTLNSDILNNLGIDKNDTEITIPTVYREGNKKYKITSIEYRTFHSCHNLTSITLPETITDIGESNFYGCDSLKTIKIPHRVKTIKSSTFNNCTSLETIELPSHLEKIGDNAFADCESLKEIDIPDSVSDIERFAFNYCESLKEIDLSSTKVTTISESCFQGCYSLTKAKLPKNLKKIENLAFNACRSLELEIPDNVSEIASNAFSQVKHIYYTDKLKADTTNAPWRAKAEN